MPVPGSTPIITTPGLRIWMLMAAGRMFLTTGTCGFPMSLTAGFRIATATGLMSLTTAGLGLATSLGDGRRITMGAGSPTAAHGPGGLGRFTLVDSTVRSGRRLMFRSGAGARVLASDLAGVVGADSAGFPSGLATGSIRGGVDTGDGLA